EHGEGVDREHALSRVIDGQVAADVDFAADPPEVAAQRVPRASDVRVMRVALGRCSFVRRKLTRQMIHNPAPFALAELVPERLRRSSGIVGIYRVFSNGVQCAKYTPFPESGRAGQF